MTVERSSQVYQDPEGIVNISSRQRESTPIGQQLSNLARTPFTLNGRHYESREALWQGLYFPEGSQRREEIAGLYGREAKLAGTDKPEGLTHIIYDGRIIRIGSPEHQQIMREAIHASVTQNPELRIALLRTGHNVLTHVLHNSDGEREPDSKSLPPEVFTQMLMDEREDLQHAPVVQ